MEVATRPIPERTNLVLAGCILVTALAMLWLGSRLPLAGTLAVGFLFSFLLLTNYALLHEATHDMLHSNRHINWLVGMILGWLFPVSFTVLHVTHIVHHCCNRTDHEMFDCYYPGDPMFVKYTQWYGLLLGLWWPFIPIGSMLLAITPGLLKTRVFRRARTTAVLFDDFGAPEARRIRAEVLLGTVFWAILFAGLGVDWKAALIMYACFAFNWSTRQYVTHAFTPRDVKNGALNLKVGRTMGWVLLNGQWDLVHHRQPHLPWNHLPQAGRTSQAPVSYWRQYARLWKGPRPCREPGPEVLPRGVYQGL